MQTGKLQDQAVTEAGPPGLVRQIGHAILEGRAPARPVMPWVSIPGPGHHGGRPSRSCPIDWSRYPGGAGSRTPCHAMGLLPGTRPSRRPALQVWPRPGSASQDQALGEADPRRSRKRRKCSAGLLQARCRRLPSNPSPATAKKSIAEGSGITAKETSSTKTEPLPNGAVLKD